MNHIRKVGGIAAFYEAAAYIMGIVFYKFIIDAPAGIEPVQRLVMLMDNRSSYYTMTLLVYVIFGIFLVALVLALYEQLKVASPTLALSATTFGIIWAGLVIASGMIFNIGLDTISALYNQNPTQATTVWLAIESVFEGLGGGNEIVGGIWVLLISWAALRAKKLSKILNGLGVIIGLAGIVSAIPVLGEIGGAIFGLGQIFWFIGLGILLLKHD